MSPPNSNPTESADKGESVELPDIELRFGAGRVWDYRRSRARAQLSLAFALLGILGLVLVGAGLALANDWASVEEVKDLLGLTIPGLAALLGTAVAFYFTESK